MAWPIRASASRVVADPRRSRSRHLQVGAVLVGAFVMGTVLAPLLAPFDPHAVPDRLDAASLHPPRTPFYLGTDLLGRDVLSRILHGGRVSLLVGLGAELIVAALGLSIGLAAGYMGGRVDGLLMRLTDVVMAFPTLVLGLGIIAVFQEPGLDKVVVVLVLLGWTTIARVVRGEVVALREREFVVAARALGAGDAALVVRHLVPNLAGPLLVLGTTGIAGNIVAEAGLSFLGLGAQPPTISWGAMLAEGQAFLTTSPWVAVFPGLALLLTVLGINLLGDGLRDVLDPHRGGTR
jgi:ABC-type dipeptide/oligopeptide/nickel transport system permease subunit